MMMMSQSKIWMSIRYNPLTYVCTHTHTRAHTHTHTDFYKQKTMEGYGQTLDSAALGEVGLRGTLTPCLLSLFPFHIVKALFL